MLMKRIIIIIIFSLSSVYAQIDTTVWYPTAKGNYWEYQDAGLFVRKGITVIGDTLMPNGKKYSIFMIEDLYTHQKNYSCRRVENNSYVYTWKGSGEYKNYDFTKNRSESWRIDSIYNRRVVKKDSSFNQLFQKKLPRMEFEDLFFTTNNDTAYVERVWQQVYKGVGDLILGEWGGYVELTGAIINNQRYGLITSVEKPNTLPSSFILFQNYPNPFNPSTIIKFNLPERAFTRLTICDISGREVAVLKNEEMNAGYHEIKFNARSMASGIYFYTIITPKFTAVKKLVLLK